MTGNFLLIPLSNELILVSAVAIAGGLYFFILGFRLLARKRLVLNTPASKIRSASLGLVEVNGRATGPYSLPAPITGSPCYLSRTIVWRQNEENRNREWRKVAEETLHVFFCLDDGTGQLLVNPAAADLDLHCDFRQTYDQTWSSPLPERMGAFLNRHGITPGGDQFRAEEWTIRPNDALYIIGTIAENPRAGSHSPQSLDTRKAAAGHSDSTSSPEVIRLSGAGTSSVPSDATQQAKIAAALHKAGITSPMAWEAAGVSNRTVTIEEPPELSQVFANGRSGAGVSGEQPGFNLNSPIVLMKGENNPAFLISWRSQRDLVRALAWKSAAMIWCGAGLTLLGIYALLAQS